MRAEKSLITAEYVSRLNAAPFFIVVDYRGLAVSHFNELRKRLTKSGAEIHVVKNSLFTLAVKETGVSDLQGMLTGQLAVVTGQKDISAAAKTLKTFQAEFDKPKAQFGYLGRQRLEAAEIKTLADLPPLEALRSQIVGLISTPASRLVRMLAAPAQQLARVVQAHADKRSLSWF